MLLVVDETQAVKNVSAQFLAVQALVAAVAASRAGRSRVLLLSGSPIDAKEQAVHVLRVLGVMKAERIAQFSIGTMDMEWRGMTEIYDYARALDPAATAAAVGAPPPTK